MKTVEVLRNWKIVNINYKEIEAKTEKEAVAYCKLCKIVYKERPFICVCKSNVFLVDIT